MHSQRPRIRSTTILTVRHNGRVAIGGDGQVSLGDTVMKSDAVKIRPLADGRVIAGFAGGAADAFALLERFEAKLKDYPANMPRAATELAKEWRTDRALRRLEAMIAVIGATGNTGRAAVRHRRCDSTNRRDSRYRLRWQLRALGRTSPSGPFKSLGRRNCPQIVRNRRRHLRVFESKHCHRRATRYVNGRINHKGHKGHKEEH